MMKRVAGLHLDDSTDGDLFLFFGPVDADSALPSVGDVLKQLLDVATVGGEEVQQWLDGSSKLFALMYRHPLDRQRAAARRRLRLQPPHA